MQSSLGFCNWNEYNLNPLTRNNWRASLVSIAGARFFSGLYPQDIRFGGLQLLIPGWGHCAHILTHGRLSVTDCDFRYMLIRPGRVCLYAVEPEVMASSRGNSSSNSVY